MPGAHQPCCIPLLTLRGLEAQLSITGSDVWGFASMGVYGILKIGCILAVAMDVADGRAVGRRDSGLSAGPPACPSCSGGGGLVPWDSARQRSKGR